MHAPFGVWEIRLVPSIMLGMVAVAVGAPPFAAEIEPQDSHRLIIRTAPGVEAMVDASGGPWFLPSGGLIDGSLLTESRRVHDVLWSEQTLSVQPLFPEANNDEIARQHRLERYHVVEFASAEALNAAALSLGNPLFEGRLLEFVQIDPIGTVADVPNDMWFAEQYGMRNTGQVISGQAGTPGSDISVVDAWAWTIGSPDVTVAVLDSGVNDHVEFSSRMLQGRNIPEGNDDVHDQCSSHGTHVTGIIAAEGDNNIGIAGVAWAVKILPVVVLEGCSGFESWCAEGIYWATQNGASIINYSLQYSSGDEPLQDAVAYAYSMGVIQVAASGNTGGSNDVQAPGRFPETIAVANIDNLDQRQPTSSQGPEIDLAAAGWQVYSCTNTNSYGYGNGTSMASPHVAGIAALLRSLAPELSPSDAKSILNETSEDIAATGYDQQTGFGRPNAWAAIQALGVDPPLPGDLNHDGEVDGIDFGLLLSGWGPCGDCEEDPCPADLNGDCTVNGIDVGLLLVDWTI